MADLEKLANELSKLSVLEAADLVKILEEKWGVSAAAPVAVAAGPAAGGAARQTGGFRPFKQTGEQAVTVSSELAGEIIAFVESVVLAMGLNLTVTSTVSDDGLEINLEGEDGGILIRRSGEGLQALQHLLATAFRRQLGEDYRVVLDCLGYRREKDAELRQMARFTAERAKATSAAQEIGPLNPYERRLVHLTVAEIAGVTSESIGDAFLKTVVISYQA